jgi:hypothetical protein
MKKLISTSIIVALTTISVSGFAETGIVVGKNKTDIIGKTAGGMSTLIIGGAVAGGPIGSLLGGLAGIWVGGKTQALSGHSEALYQVENSSGNVREFRSPNYQFNVGDQVVISGIRIKPKAI